MLNLELLFFTRLFKRDAKNGGACGKTVSPPEVNKERRELKGESMEIDKKYIDKEIAQTEKHGRTKCITKIFKKLNFNKFVRTLT